MIDKKFVVERVLGAGGMGVVVAAQHLVLGERVALKLLKASAEPSETTTRRLQREARAAARLRSKHAVRVLDVGKLDDGSPFLVLEYVDGCTLAERLSREGPLPHQEAVDHVLQACDAVAEAHSLGIIHRDLKPSNLMRSELPNGSPWIYVLDFGIAKVEDSPQGSTLTHESAMLGSPQYMSPEQIANPHKVSALTDIWSLGVTLYELLSGRSPFEAESTSGLLVSISTREPRPLASLCPGLPEGLVREIHRCLDKTPDGRPPSVAALAAALEPFGSPSSAGAGARVARVLDGDPDREKPGPVLRSPGPPDEETQQPQATTATATSGAPRAASAADASGATRAASAADATGATDATDAAISTRPARARSPRSLAAALVSIPLLAALFFGAKPSWEGQSAASPQASEPAPSAASPPAAGPPAASSPGAQAALDPPGEAPLPAASASAAQPPKSAASPSATAQRLPARATKERPAGKAPLLPEYGARK